MSRRFGSRPREVKVARVSSPPLISIRIPIECIFTYQGANDILLLEMDEGRQRRCDADSSGPLRTANSLPL